MLFFSKKLNAVQSEQLKQFDSRLTEAKIEQGKQQERAAKADARVAGLEKDASDAKAAQQRVETELANQKERTASAEKAASDAALALAKFKAQRVLSNEQSNAITAKVKPFPVKFDVAASSNSETLNLVMQIEDALKAAGWEELDWPSVDGNLVHSLITRPGRVSIGIAIEHGVTIQVVQPEKEELLAIAKTLSSALSAEGISARAQFMAVDQSNKHTIHVVVGEKPVP